MTKIDFKTLISLLATVISLSSAFISFLNYRKTIKENERNKKELFVSSCLDKFDLLFVEFNSFAERYAILKDTDRNDKSIYREKILYLEDSIGNKFHSSTLVDLKDKYTEFSIFLSDLLYANTINPSDLTKIRLLIQSLKRRIENS